jgi:hypothetical protein
MIHSTTFSLHPRKRGCFLLSEKNSPIRYREETVETVILLRPVFRKLSPGQVCLSPTNFSSTCLRLHDSVIFDWIKNYKPAHQRQGIVHDEIAN